MPNLELPERSIPTFQSPEKTVAGSAPVSDFTRPLATPSITATPKPLADPATAYAFHDKSLPIYDTNRKPFELPDLQARSVVPPSSDLRLPAYQGRNSGGQGPVRERQPRGFPKHGAYISSMGHPVGVNTSIAKSRDALSGDLISPSGL